MRTMGRGSGSPIRIGVLALLFVAMRADALPAHAGLYSAALAYKKGDFTLAFRDFLALARLGQPQAQLELAYLYSLGQGARQSDIHAYAWAMLASQNGEAKGQKLARRLLPALRLAPGSRRIAGWITAPYTPAALNRTLLPTYPHAGLASNGGHPAGGGAPNVFGTRSNRACLPIRMHRDVYPWWANLRGMQDRVLVQFTLMPDGTARLPEVIFGLPERSFDAAARTSVVMSKFAHRPLRRHPIRCALDFQFVERNLSSGDYPRLQDYLWGLRKKAVKGDPAAEAIYGTVLAGLPQIQSSRRTSFLPWLVRAAQAGDPLAQYEVGASLQFGFGGCLPDEVKALRWLHLAAAQHEADAEVALAVRLLDGASDAGQIDAARKWLDQAVTQGNVAGEMYLSALLAAARQAAVRDPARALRLERKAFAHVDVDPTGYEIRAAAQAAEGHFTQAVKSEREAIGKAHALEWNLSALKRRLALYRSGKPWYGDLLDYGSPTPAKAGS